MIQNAPNAQDRGHVLQLTDPLLEWENMDAPTGTSRFRFPQKKNVITILLIGETGSGKTSFMSLLLNLFEGSGPFELRDKHFIDAQSGLHRTQSQTTEARIYSFTTIHGAKVEILDTPGLADTRGIEEDKKHKERIYRAIQELITAIDGVMIVANGTVERLTVATDYTLNILATLFPRSILDNIGILFTNTDAGGTGLNFQMQSLPSELRNVQHWCLNNPLSLYKNYSTLKAGSNFVRNQESIQKRNIETNYQDAVEILNDWLEWLDERNEIPTTAIVELYQKSSHIESRLFSTVTSISNLSQLEAQLLEISSNLKSAQKLSKRLTYLQKRIPPKVWVLQSTSDHNTICAIPTCHNNCHTTCTLELGDAATIGGTCKAFRTWGIPNKWLPFWSNAKVKCGEAKCGHEARFHRCYQKIHTQIENKSYARIVRRLNNAASEKEKLEDVKADVEQEMEEIKAEIERSKRDIPKLVEELNKLSLSPNYAVYIWSALDILKMRREQLLSRGDFGNELRPINEGIKAFEAQLDLLRGNEAGRIVETSGRTEA
ncbi:hypothetical protein ACGC1H_003103 [Rhizoctonia solani]|uniref:AIG1-type G domain-containing protein n=1 Tax=Rhizoctonia solani TaxID=456999 RepID=A0A8H3BN19_9AGAM|nr:unnamed protein product [Rhizoctonia solani]